MQKISNYFAKGEKADSRDSESLGSTMKIPKIPEVRWKSREYDGIPGVRWESREYDGNPRSTMGIPGVR
jgi:hypothetical protein